eukprot:TRINITY_DN23548_c1_g1_i1.p1 TRINITY_DN23548_c1_g1~~TRINITY_DN23548_c1_g1_i1.p1  ORF type:complete len:235 (+),score=24.98 TRINITY_DN23548_c1_g1_i1:102-806(+)
MAAASARCVTSLTSFMIKNIPSRCGQQDLVEVLQSSGFGRAYDFLHLPVKNLLGKSQNRGYAFVNFLDPVTGDRFCEFVNAGSLKVRQKVASVAPAQVQGLLRLRQLFRNSAVINSPAAPLFVESDSPSARPRATSIETGEAPAAARRLTVQYVNSSERCQPKLDLSLQSSLPMKVVLEMSSYYSAPMKVEVNWYGALAEIAKHPVMTPEAVLPSDAPRYVTYSGPVAAPMHVL